VTTRRALCCAGLGTVALPLPPSTNPLPPPHTTLTHTTRARALLDVTATAASVWSRRHCCCCRGRRKSALPAAAQPHSTQAMQCSRIRSAAGGGLQHSNMSRAAARRPCVRVAAAAKSSQPQKKGGSGFGNKGAKQPVETCACGSAKTYKVCGRACRCGRWRLLQR
jgi:hypothetical protein